ncbi:MAG: hypothetical protein ACRDTC_01500, partial [Pseudonocardiaceae bacterium]
ALTGIHVTTEQLTTFACGSAANFLVESTTESATVAFRLFHQALSDALAAERARLVLPAADEAALTTAFTGYGTRIGWDHTPTYLFRSLPGHAVRAGMIDKLLVDTAYVLRADLRRLIPAAAHTHTPTGAQRAHLLRLTPRAITADPPERLALLSVTEAFDGFDTAFRHHRHSAPYRGLWANTPRRAERAILEGHTGGVTGVCGAGGRTRPAGHRQRRPHDTNLGPEHRPSAPHDPRPLSGTRARAVQRRMSRRRKFRRPAGWECPLRYTAVRQAERQHRCRARPPVRGHSSAITTSTPK